ncbi:MAG: methyl-accepting chemotaxis protein [Synergistaceae bacterium]|jgi:methyl-accepting chemotaxis protein|nr:methyl-accepting chemotaxis protein [Synergistaceae bacterium]
MGNLSIKTKVIMSFAAIVILNICFGLYAISSLSVIDYRVEDADSWTVGLAQISDLQLNASAARRYDLSYLLQEDDRGRSDASSKRSDAMAAAEDVMAVYKSEVLTIPYNNEEERQTDLEGINEVIDLWNAYKASSNNIMTISGEDTQTILPLVNGESADSFAALERSLANLAQYNIEGSAAGVEMSEEIYASTRNVILGFLVVVTVFSVLVTCFLTIGIKRSIDELRRVSEAVGDGDLTVKTHIYSHDDLGILSEQYNVTIARVKALISRIQDSAERLAESTGSLNTSASDTASEGAVIEHSMEKTSLNANNQLSEIKTITSTIMSISEGIASEMENVGELARSARDSVEKSRAGEHSIDLTVTQMNMIEDAVEASAKVVTSLGERSGEIGQIVATITGISSQTNLLALNAAIEAARAGEHGLGFAVVADEVKKLAGESRAAADEIAGLISGIQEETNRAVESMRLGMEEAHKGSDAMRDSGRVFGELVDSSVASASGLQNVADIMRALESGVSDLVGAARNVENMSRVIAEDSQSVVASTEAQTASVAEISESSQDLARIASELLDTTNQFVI